MLYAFKPTINEIKTNVPPPLHPRLHPCRDKRALRSLRDDAFICPSIYRLGMAKEGGANVGI